MLRAWSGTNETRLQNREALKADTSPQASVVARTTGNDTDGNTHCTQTLASQPEA